jgi:hypothetical protein
LFPLLDQKKQAKLQWLQDPTEILVNGDDLNNIRRDLQEYKEEISERQNS